MCRFFLKDTRLEKYEREMMAVPGFGLRRVTPKNELTQEWIYEDYSFPEGDGCFEGVLVMKKWNRCNGMNCFFNCADGRKYTLCVWDKNNMGREYAPVNSDINLSLIPIGTTLRAKYQKTRSGKTKWLDVEIPEVPE